MEVSGFQARHSVGKVLECGFFFANIFYARGISVMFTQGPEIVRKLYGRISRIESVRTYDERGI